MSTLGEVLLGHKMCLLVCCLQQLFTPLDDMEREHEDSADQTQMTTCKDDAWIEQYNIKMTLNNTVNSTNVIDCYNQNDFFLGGG